MIQLTYKAGIHSSQHTSYPLWLNYRHGEYNITCIIESHSILNV